MSRAKKWTKVNTFFKCKPEKEILRLTQYDRTFASLRLCENTKMYSELRELYLRKQTPFLKTYNTL